MLMMFGFDFSGFPQDQAEAAHERTAPVETHQRPMIYS
jgi:hypothetical protein